MYSTPCFRKVLGDGGVHDNLLFYTNLVIFVCLCLFVCSCVCFGRRWTQNGHKTEAAILDAG